MQALGLQQYINVFIQEEIDTTIVHMLNDSDLMSMGVRDRLHQRKIMDTAQREAQQKKKITAQVNGTSTKIEHSNQKIIAARNPPPPHHHHDEASMSTSKTLAAEFKQQRTLLQLHTNSRARRDTLPGSHFKVNSSIQQNMGSMKIQNATITGQHHTSAGDEELEQSILHAIYPKSAHVNNTPASFLLEARRPDVVIAPHDGMKNAVAPKIMQQQRRVDDGVGGDYTEQQGAQDNDSNPAIESRQLNMYSRVSPSSSLWTSAARCEWVTETLDDRIERKRKEKGKEEEGLYRGGVRYTFVQESRALKTVQLESLKKELKEHQQMVKELEQQIAMIEKELAP